MLYTYISNQMKHIQLKTEVEMKLTNFLIVYSKEMIMINIRM